MIGSSVPRRERRPPRVLDWSQVEQIVAGERKPRDREQIEASRRCRTGSSRQSKTSDCMLASPALALSARSQG
jgi:hypothetical protein